MRHTIDYMPLLSGYFTIYFPTSLCCPNYCYKIWIQSSEWVLQLLGLWWITALTVYNHKSSLAPINKEKVLTKSASIIYNSANYSTPDIIRIAWVSKALSSALHCHCLVWTWFVRNRENVSFPSWLWTALTTFLKGQHVQECPGAIDTKATASETCDWKCLFFEVPRWGGWGWEKPLKAFLAVDRHL